MTFYNLFAGLVAWTVLAVAFRSGGTPLGVVVELAGFLGVTDVSVIDDIDQWMQARSEVVAVVSGLVGLISLGWSFAWLYGRGYLFDRVRGPATGWVCAGVLVQLYSWRAVVLVCVAAIAGLTLLALVDLAQRKQAESRYTYRPALLSRTMLILFAGGLLVVFWPALLMINALGGRSSKQQSNQSPPV